MTWLPTHRHKQHGYHIRLVRKIDGVAYCDFDDEDSLAITVLEIDRDYELIEISEDSPTDQDFARYRELLTQARNGRDLTSEERKWMQEFYKAIKFPKAEIKP